MQNFILKGFIFVVFFFLMACHRTVVVGNTDSLVGLQALAAPKKTCKTANNGRIREMALKELALTLGAQSGLAWRADIIDRALARQARYLDTIYDFNFLVLEHNILPPVLLEGRNTFNLADTQTIRISDRTYKVAKQARFITTPPNWRQYLWMDYRRPDYPPSGLLPRTRKEKEIWRYYVEKGWQQGAEQAGTILEESLARIKEDFGGMILYRKLLAMNMVSPPFVSHTDLGVTGDSSEIHIDDRVLRITALPGLNVNSNEWRAAVSKDETVLQKLDNLEKESRNSSIPITINTGGWRPIIAAGH
jgi:defect-in-organelle-trafficking protein DotC